MQLKDLKPNTNNPRKISDQKLLQLKKALNEFGDISGIVFNRKSKQIVGGHQRVKHFSPTSPITIIKKYSKPTKTGTVAEGFIELKGERFSYREVEWPKKKEMAANLAANNNAGEWDTSKLGEWLKELDEVDFDLDLTMFDEDKLFKFGGIEKSHTSDKTGVDEDEVPVVKEPKSKLGDLYLLGEHRLMCGDSTSKEQVEKLMDGEKADMVFTDPPYNAQIKEIKNDSFADINDFIKFMKDWVGVAEKFLKESCSFYCWGFWKTSSEVKVNVFNHFQDFNFMNMIIWSKPSIKVASNYYKTSYEVCLFFQRGKPVFTHQQADTVRKSTSERWEKVADANGYYSPQGAKEKKFNINFHTATDVWEDIPPMGRGGNKECLGVHPTQKPIKACERAICASSEVNKSVLDLFGGSGSTLIACEKTNRKCFMMEIDPHYCDVIVERWEKYTGQKASLLNSEKTVKHAKKS